VRLKNSDIIGELAEEGYRTRDLFLCLGPQEESDDVWQIGRSFAVLMSQEEFAEQIDSANSKDRIIEVVDTFIDQSVIIPGKGGGRVQKEDTNLTNTGSEAGHSDPDSDRDSDHDAKEDGGRRSRASSGVRRRSSSAKILAPPQDQKREKSWFEKIIAFLGLERAEKITEAALTIDVPQHIALQQRRRARIARERRAQLIKFAVTEDGEEVPKHHEWTPKDKQGVLGILVGSLAIVLLLACWVGPSLKDTTSTKCTCTALPVRWGA